jgi:ankyrin repeat protein
MPRILVCFVSGLISLVPAIAAAQAPEATRIRDAITRGYAAIQTAQKVSRKTQACAATCHLQVYGAFSYRAIRGQGFAVDEDAARADLDRAFRRTVTDFDAAVADNSLGEVGINQTFFLVAAHEIGLQSTVATSAIARAIALQQTAAGSWPAFYTRPPSSHSPFTFTAFGLRSLQLYGHPNLKADTTARVARAKAWLQSQTAPDTEGRTYQLLGLWWAGADRQVLQPLAGALAKLQQPDGGWNSLAGRASDAYSTGEVLVALHDAGGMSTQDPVWRRGLEFLLRSQVADGTWHVPTRLPSWVNPPYFESGYPYKRDQFISVAGANWSLRALALALGAPTTPDRLPLADVRPREIEPWVETAMFGSTADLKRLLDQGLSPDAATASGTSLLMTVVPDLEKVQLLVQRGADVNALSSRRYSALLVAAQYENSTEVIRALMARGAQVRVPPDKGKPAANASALFFAAHSGNATILPMLQKAGDDPDSPTMMFGTFPVTPLHIATAWGYTPVMRALLDLGAKADGQQPNSDGPLIFAVQNHQVEAASLLIERRADVNRPGDKGRTPLMHAAIADFGDARMVELLLKAGARTDARDADGLTAADYAREYRHDRLLGLLK